MEAAEWVTLGMIEYLSTAVRAPIHLFLALGAKQVGEQHPDPGEMVQRTQLPFMEAVAHVRNGVITHAPSCVLILLAEAYLRQRLGTTALSENKDQGNFAGRQVRTSQQ